MCLVSVTPSFTAFLFLFQYCDLSPNCLSLLCSLKILMSPLAMGDFSMVVPFFYDLIKCGGTMEA
jgi:hypothetical protein